MRSLIVGNGINLIKNNEFDAKAVAKRFKYFLKVMTPALYAALTPEIIINSDVEDLWSESKCALNESVEVLAQHVYNTIKDKYFGFHNKNKIEGWINTEQRLVKILTSIGTSAIYINNGRIKKADVPDEIIRKVRKYDKVFSLNYCEKWDYKNQCIYLTGRIGEYNCEGSNKPFIFYDKDVVCGSGKYKIAIEELNGEFETIGLPKDILFLPASEDIDKNDFFGPGLYPSDELIAADDLYPKDDEDIYSLLDGISDVSLFGISPIGDKGIIKKLDNIDKVTIFVYKLRANTKERDEWSRLIPSAILKDSNEF